MKFQLVIDKAKINSLFKIDLSKFYLLSKHDVSMFCFYFGMTLAYFGSLHPWFLWPLKELYVIPSCFFLILSFLVSNSMRQTLFPRKDFMPGIITYVILSFYICVVGDLNVNAYIVTSFTPFIFFMLLKSEPERLQRFITFISKVMAVLLIPSMLFFLLYLIGFSLPSRNAVFGENQYSFTNYYFFMVDDRQIVTLIPRFSSVFLEPGHLGSATTLLLMTQCGRWKKWWNITLLIATLISFSLAAYAILIALIFLNLWVQRKNIVGKVIGAVLLISSVAVGAVFYNGGDNMVNDLILARLEVDEKTGDMVGNNRVSEDFEKEFDKFAKSSDVFFGRDMSKIARGTGNSGYRVYIYQNGLVGLLLTVLFYAFSFKKSEDKRELISVIIISLLIFWIRGYPLWYSNFFPLFICAYNKEFLKQAAAAKCPNPVSRK